MSASNQLAQLRKQLSRQTASIQSQLNSDARLRIGVWLILLMLILQPIWFLQDYRTGQSAELDNLLSQEAKIRRTTSENLWQERASISSQKLADLEQKISAASSLGVAKATLQSQITSLLDDVGAADKRIDLQDPSETPITGIYRVSASIQLGLEQNRLFQLLESLENNQSGLVIERLEVSELRSGRALLFITAYFKLNGVREQNATANTP
jgi:hypothetical protein